MTGSAAVPPVADKITLEALPQAKEKLDAACLQYPANTTCQVSGTHNGAPKTDVYAFSMVNGLDPMQFNVVKYVTHFCKNDCLKDLKKAMQTLECLVAHKEAKK